MVFDCIKKFDKLDVEICEVYSSQSFEVFYRVATDLKNLEKSGNLKETSESPLTLLFTVYLPQVREFATEFQKSEKVREFFV